MMEPIETILAECLSALQAGRADVEACLRRYPDRREELEPVLRAWAWVQSAPSAVPAVQFQRAAHDRLLSRLGPQSAPPQRKKTRRPLFAGLRLAVLALAAIFAVLASGAGVAYASETALPGDALYSAKTAIEEVRLAFASSEGDVNLFNQFANRRVEEMQALLAAGRTEDLPVAAQGYEKALEGMSRALSDVAEEDLDKAETLAAVLAEAHQKRTEVLNGLLETAPEAAHKGLERALQVGPPEGKGKPGDKGKPENPGCPEQAGPKEGKGKPQDKGKPDNGNTSGDPGEPEDAGSSDDRCAPDEDVGDGTEIPDTSPE